MPAYISPLDNAYIPLKRAARLIAGAQTGVTPDEIMELFKHAIFSGEFECKATDIPGLGSRHELNWLHATIDVPVAQLAAPHPPPESAPVKFYAVRRQTIASLLFTRDALPGGSDAWESFFDLPDEDARGDLYHRLAHIPYASYTRRARRTLEDVHVPTPKLKIWLIAKRYAVPEFLKEVTVPRPGRPDLKLVTSDGEDTSSEKQQGRPRKAAWPRIEEIVRELHKAEPGLLKKELAYRAYEIVAKEFDEMDLPSSGTIIRQMSNILNEDV